MPSVSLKNSVNISAYMHSPWRNVILTRDSCLANETSLHIVFTIASPIISMIFMRFLEIKISIGIFFSVSDFGNCDTLLCYLLVVWSVVVTAIASYLVTKWQLFISLSYIVEVGSVSGPLHV